jgi:putative transposase
VLTEIFSGDKTLGMLQAHSFHRLYFHLVFAVKNREPLIRSMNDGEEIFGLLKVKATLLEAYVEEFGCWRDHVHMLVRSTPKIGLSVLYGQMKGFCSHAWNKKHPEHPIGWQDGVYSVTVDPDNSATVREYIRSQWHRHEQRDLLLQWELPDTAR